jgi:hypothetical protein
MLKHWRTSLCGLICWLFDLAIIYELVRDHVYNFSRPLESLHFWAAPLALFMAGLALFHAADHKNLPPDPPKT